MANETDTRPWGNYEVLYDGDDHKVKRISVLPGKRLSLQSHDRRAEHWFIASGKGVVTVGEELVPVEGGTAVDIPLKAKHRIENTGDVELVFIEVQTGNYFGEDDIIRYEDDFGRT